VGVRITNDPEIFAPRTGQRDLPVLLPRGRAIAERSTPRMPQFSDRPHPSNFRGHLIDLMV